MRDQIRNNLGTYGKEFETALVKKAVVKKALWLPLEHRDGACNLAKAKTVEGKSYCYR